MSTRAHKKDGVIIGRYDTTRGPTGLIHWRLEAGGIVGTETSVANAKKEIEHWHGREQKRQAVADTAATMRADAGKVFIPGIGHMTPGECTPSWCGRSHGAKCFNAGRCQAARKRAKP